jgi:hypothetical protein
MEHFSFLYFLDLNKAVLGFQATSFIIMVLAAISFFCMMSDNDDDDDDDDDDDKENGCLVTCLSFIIVLYPISGKLLKTDHLT